MCEGEQEWKEQKGWSEAAGTQAKGDGKMV